MLKKTIENVIEQAPFKVLVLAKIKDKITSLRSIFSNFLLLATNEYDTA